MMMMYYLRKTMTQTLPEQQRVGIDKDGFPSSIVLRFLHFSRGKRVLFRRKTRMAETVDLVVTSVTQSGSGIGRTYEVSCQTRIINFRSNG
jgi:hypothetical protein